jgi:hypothetical protein
MVVRRRRAAAAEAGRDTALAASGASARAPLGDARTLVVARQAEIVAVPVSPPAATLAQGVRARGHRCMPACARRGCRWRWA